MNKQEALRYCNNRIQELTNSYNNETIQKLRDIIESLFSYLDEDNINTVEVVINKMVTPVIDIINLNNDDYCLTLFTFYEYSKYDGYLTKEERSFDLHNINKLFDWVFKDESR